MYVKKKPLNQIDNPIQPFIKKDQPRFYRVKKHWEVNVADVLRDQEFSDQTISDKVLAVGWDDNQKKYGRSSYTPKVNREFRPPLIDPILDVFPLSRIPRPQTQVRINPDASHIAQTQNAHDQDVSSHINRRVIYASVAPTYFSTFSRDTLKDHIIPDLKLKMPCVSASAGINTPAYHENGKKEWELKRNSEVLSVGAGINTPYKSKHLSPLEQIELEYNNPQVQASAGFEAGYKEQNDINEDIDLEFNNPQVCGVSGAKVAYSKNIHDVVRGDDVELQFNLPQVSGNAGTKTNYSKNIHETTRGDDLRLQFNNPQTSMSINPEGMCQMANWKQDATKRLINPIRVAVQATPQYSYKKYEHNEQPRMRPVLDVRGSVCSEGSRPQAFQHQYPKLKSLNRPYVSREQVIY